MSFLAVSRPVNESRCQLVNGKVISFFIMGRIRLCGVSKTSPLVIRKPVQAFSITVMGCF